MIQDILVVYVSESSAPLAGTIAAALGPAAHTMLHRDTDTATLRSARSIIFVGAVGICVRTVIPAVCSDKHTDPAVVCVDATGRYAIPILSGHIGGANTMARTIALAIGGEAVITTQSDNTGLWALDTLATDNGWLTDATPAEMNAAIFKYVGGRPTALLLDVRDAATARLESTMAPHVRLISTIGEAAGAELVIAVTHALLTPPPGVMMICYRPPVLSLGVGCRRQCPPDGIADHIAEQLLSAGLSPLSVGSISTIELKKDEPLLRELAQHWPMAQTRIFTASQLAGIPVPNPSQRVFDTTGTPGVAEAAAIAAADHGPLLIEKRKGALSPGADFTFAVALHRATASKGHIEIVGAGPGDPDLVSVRGRRFLEQADLILYAGSLVPRALTECAKPGCLVRSSADLDLEAQFDLMRRFYDEGRLVVRLHTGDPCIYGAIQEQMAYFDRYGMSYHITPGISSFQAAAAELRSQFTIPERVQSIILTRGEGRTPMPPREKLSLLARSQSTMCIYLSAAIVEDVQAQLLEEYPPETPVAACYKLTWPEQRIYRGELRDLARIVRDNHLTLTTLLVVGEAIDNRQGLSRLYDRHFTHLFRRGEEDKS